MSVSCNKCGQTWERDPRLEVPCPRCNVEVGQVCRRPSEHPTFGGVPHREREELAIQSGFLTRECPGMQKGAA